MSAEIVEAKIEPLQEPRIPETDGEVHILVRGDWIMIRIDYSSTEGCARSSAWFDAEKARILGRGLLGLANELEAKQRLKGEGM